MLISGSLDQLSHLQVRRAELVFGGVQLPGQAGGVLLRDFRLLPRLRKASLLRLLHASCDDRAARR